MNMDNPVFKSSQFASTTKKPSLIFKRQNPLSFDSSETMTMSHGFSGCTTFRPCDKPMIRRHSRNYQAKQFRNQYFYGRSMDRKTCIWSGDGDSWLDKTSGIMWVGVHGMDSICVVSRTGDLDIKRVCGNLKNDTIELFLHNFRKTIIAEIEDLEDPSINKSSLDFLNKPNKLRQRVGQSIKKPFGIVSVDTDEVYEESGDEVSYDEHLKNMQANRDAGDRLLACVKRLRPDFFPAAPVERDEKNTIKFLQEKMETETTFSMNEARDRDYDEKKAVNFLQEKMESGVAFTTDETIQSAISAFQHLLGKKLKANEIGVTVIDPDYINVSKHEAKYEDVYAKELEIFDIENHLAAINEPGSSRSGNLTIVKKDENDK